ncbi:MAG: hypothetical protein J2P34_05140 [Actinobacteria bacterium]|nr:hypothetical protein [Actinomycetota bacterium]
MAGPDNERPGARHGGEDARHGGEDAGDELEGMFYQPNVNQRRHEPMPASHDDERRQEAVRQNEAYAHGYADREDREGQGEVPGQLTPGPEDPGTPPTHATSGQGQRGRVTRVRRVARAARGRPDGEVDPHS